MMVTATKVQQVIQEVEQYMGQFGGYYRDWYAGIATDPRQRLFVEHNVNEQTGQWIYRDCLTDGAARQVEEYFLKKGCKGAPGGGDSTTRYFYAYRITSQTRE